jgi:hypothetical protein
MKATRAPLQVAIAHTEGCEHASGARDLVKRIAAELDLCVKVTMVLVTTSEDAERFRLHGSPTVLVNGQDVEPDMRHRTDYGFG